MRFPCVFCKKKMKRHDDGSECKNKKRKKIVMIYLLGRVGSGRGEDKKDKRVKELLMVEVLSMRRWLENDAEKHKIIRKQNTNNCLNFLPSNLVPRSDHFSPRFTKWMWSRIALKRKIDRS